MVAAIKPSTSAARVAANRLNARQSSGLKTVEGKARSRANAVKHGLTGAGVALPTEDAALVERRFVGLQEDMAPSDLLSRLLVSQMALMSVRIERAARHETAALAARIRRAGVAHDLQRQGEVDRLFATIETSPGENRRLLLTYPEGVDKLDEALRSARDQLVGRAHRLWTDEDRKKFEALFGTGGTQFPVSRVDALPIALGGNFLYIDPRETAHLAGGSDRRRWARQELIGRIDAELARLAATRADLDLDAIAQDRLEAADRALFDHGPVALTPGGTKPPPSEGSRSHSATSSRTKPSSPWPPWACPSTNRSWWIAGIGQPRSL